MVWIVKLVSAGAEGEEHSADNMRIAKPDDLGDLANLGLTLAEGKLSALLLAGIQQEIVAVQARVHAVRRPDFRACGDVCRVKDDRRHGVATLFGPVTVRLPRFRCAGCGATEAGVEWPSHARSTPELDRLRALNDYLTGQSDWLVNDAERHRAGLRVGTALTAGTPTSW